MSGPLLTKRLHVSGLTPSITPADLEHRLSSFGKVKAMDGFGARDALGDPRKFGFVTMEISAKQLAKCLNVLSGSTWKGAKLRIGEAIPDFRERLAQINSQPPPPVRPTRTRARNFGRPSTTLPPTPLSVTAAASTPGWIATPSGRIVRPMRMRPDRPLEPIRGGFTTSKTKGLNGKVKKRVKAPPIRARRRLIDPTKWDSVYLTGVFLDAVTVPLPTSQDTLEPQNWVKCSVVAEEDEEKMDERTDDDSSSASQHEVEPSKSALEFYRDRAHATLSPQQSHMTAFADSSPTHEVFESIDVRGEANAALVMLQKMFGDEDWDGRESVDEMQDLEDGERENEMPIGEEDDVEIVPRNFAKSEPSKITKKSEGKDEEKLAGNKVTHDVDVEMEEVGLPAGTDVSAQTTAPVARTNLKTLFAPREEASFSLLDHLDLDQDLELDTDIFGISAPGPSQENGYLSEPPRVVQTPAIAVVSKTKARSHVTLDPSLPLLFPLNDSLPHSYSPSDPTSTIHRHGTQSCILFPSTTRVQGLHHLSPSIALTRSQQDTPESIREWWEKAKSGLTYEWKRAWRESRGSRRGRAAAGGEIGGGP